MILGDTLAGKLPEFYVPTDQGVPVVDIAAALVFAASLPTVLAVTQDVRVQREVAEGQARKVQESAFRDKLQKDLRSTCVLHPQNSVG